MNMSLPRVQAFRCVCVALILLMTQSELLGAQQPAKTAVDELVDIMRENSSVEVKKITEIPTRLRGKLIAIAEFSEEQKTWAPMNGLQDFGQVTADRMSVLGYELGHEGSVEARYLEFTDRCVVSYTGVTLDRRLSANLYDDENDKEHIILQVRVGPRQFRYLLMRPSMESTG